MSKKSRKPTKRSPPKPAPAVNASTENRSSEALTVAWTLACMSTAGADIVALVLWLLGRFWPGAENQPNNAWLFLPVMALFTAAVSGVVCLILTPFVYRLRRIPPPPAITTFAVVVSGLPLGLLAALLLSS